MRTASLKSQMGLRLYVALALLVSGLVLVVPPERVDAGIGPAQASDGVLNGRIAFIRNANNGETDVASVDPRGRNFVHITRSDANELYVDVSPNGKWVAFTRFGRRGGEIYTARISGGGITRLTSDRVHDELPIWSPDSRRIAFVRYPRGEEDGEIFVIGADGSDLQRVTRNETGDADPRWSPDGTRLIYNGGNIDDNTQDVFLVTPGEPGVTRLTQPDVNDTFAEWSPGGERIVYSSYREGQWDIFTVTPDGLLTTQLTDSPLDDYATEWSPDGARLAFIRGRLEGNLPRDEVYVMNADGSDEHSVSPARLQAFSSEWSPDGTRIAFIGQVDTGGELLEWEIFTVAPDGTSLKRLTRTGPEEFDPEWAPRHT